MDNKELLFANVEINEETNKKATEYLSIENANMKRRIDDLLQENTEWKLENERLNNNWQQAIEDLTKIANELGLEEGSTIYDILDKLKELKEGR